MEVKERRRASPLAAQRIWDAIKQQSQRKKPATAETVSQFCERTYSMTSGEVKEQLHLLIKDGLVLKTKHSNKSEQKETTYSLPKDPVESGFVREDHDWYCFECHKAGSILDCSSCFRVYHRDCLKGESLERTFVCPMCKVIKESPPCNIKQIEINQLLTLTCERLRENLPINITVWVPTVITAPSATYTTDRRASLQTKELQKQLARTSKDPKQSDSSAETWRAGYLLYNPMDISTMESKADRQVYRSLAQFQVDAATVLHNVVVFHGEHSTTADMARVMYRDCLSDLSDIRQCRKCYRLSHLQTPKNWFIEPCKPPHELVFAKHKDLPFWPAKVMKITGDSYDVRFFGRSHERAVVDKQFIRPITVNTQSIDIKRTPAWNKAYEELCKHQHELQLKNDNSSDEESDSGSSSSSNEGTSSGEDKTLPKKLEPQRKVPRVELKKLEPETLQVAAPVAEAKPPSRKRVRPVLKATARVVRTESSGGAEAESEALVTSSSSEPNPDNKLVPDNELSALRERNLELEREVKRLRSELDDIQSDHKNQIKDLNELHQKQLSETKKTQWCYNCEAEAIYHCCWNTAYCSVECQQAHWAKDHKYKCRRKQ